jgi:hypothetical protein
MQSRPPLGWVGCGNAGIWGVGGVGWGVGKTLCDWTKKEIKKHFEEVCEIVADPRYVCRKCGRCAHFPRFLCEPKKVATREKE